MLPFCFGIISKGRILFKTAYLLLMSFAVFAFAQEVETESPASNPVENPSMPPDTIVVEMVDLVDPVPDGETKSLLPAPTSEAVPALNRALEKIDIGGRIQFKGFHHDIFSESDSDKRLSFQLRRLSLDVNGRFADQFGFKMEALLEVNNHRANLNQAYLFHEWNEHWGIRAGKLKRPISQEALQSSKRLNTIERSGLYHEFLSKETGYIMQDIGLILNGGFEDNGIPVGYQLGVFNGKNPANVEDNYANQHLESTDRGFLAKDVVLRAHAKPFPELFVEGAFATKGAEDRSNPVNFKFRMNTAYQLGFAFNRGKVKVLGETAWGDNHQGRDDFIGVDSLTSTFFTFYVTGMWRTEYSRNRASELVLQLEGLDPDTRLLWQEEEGRPNDSHLRYYVGSNYDFNRHTGVQLGYSIIHPITEVVGEGDLRHNLEFMWRMFF